MSLTNMRTDEELQAQFQPEELEVIPWKLDDLGDLILREDFSEGRTIASLFIAREWLRQQG